MAGRGRVGGDIPMLAEVLSARGYATAAFTGGANMAAHFGFDRGFDVYATAGKRMIDMPRGTLLLPTFKPLDIVVISRVSAMGSGSAATPRTSAAVPRRRSGVNKSRSSTDSLIPSAWAKRQSALHAGSEKRLHRFAISPVE